MTTMQCIATNLAIIMSLGTEHSTQTRISAQDWPSNDISAYPSLPQGLWLNV
jgi:hypothetical protein